MLIGALEGSCSPRSDQFGEFVLDEVRIYDRVLDSDELTALAAQ